MKKVKNAVEGGKGNGLLEKLTPGNNGDGAWGTGAACRSSTPWTWPSRSRPRGREARPKHVHFTGKIWGVRREWDAEIVAKRTHEVIAWESEDGLDNSGVVTFHKPGPRLTHIELNLDVAPHGPVEKIGRGMRFTKRAVRADLHRLQGVCGDERGLAALMKVPKAVERGVKQRLSGNRTSRWQATVSAAVAGGAVAATVYRGLRS